MSQPQSAASAKRPLVLVDPVPQPEGHSLTFNAAFVKLARHSGRWSSVTFLSSPELCRRLENRSLPDAVTLVDSLSTIDWSSGGIRQIARLARNYWRSFQTAQEMDAELIFTHAECMSLAVFLAIVPQGWIDASRITLVDQLPFYLRQRTPHRWFFSLLLRGLSGILVFEELFVESVERFAPAHRHPRIRVVHHPPYWETTAEYGRAESGSDRTRSIRQVGSLRPEKGASLLGGAVRLLGSDPGRLGKREIGVHGTIASEFYEEIEESPLPHGLNLEDSYLDRDRYVELIQTAHFVLMLHSDRFFPKVSGVLMDAIALGVPIIASNTRLHRYYFDRYGPFGILLESNEPAILVDALERTQSINRQTYQSFQDNMARFRQDRDMSTIASQLSTAMA